MRGLIRSLTVPVIFSLFVYAQTVVTNPTTNQNIVQPVNTSFSANNYGSIRYVTASYNWTQAPSSPASLTGGTQATVTLTPCPLGINTSNNINAPYSVYVSGTGAAEPVTVVGGTCTAGSGSGTIIFTPGQLSWRGLHNPVSFRWYSGVNQ